jgi:hypothetical protein
MRGYLQSSTMHTVLCRTLGSPFSCFTFQALNGIVTLDPWTRPAFGYLHQNRTLPNYCTAELENQIKT